MKGIIPLVAIAAAPAAQAEIAAPNSPQTARAEISSTDSSTVSSTGGSGLSASVGVDYSSGDYGAGVDTDILIVPISLRYRSGNLRFTATVPWLHIRGSSAIVGGGAGGVIIDPDAPRTSRSGLGDLSLGVGYLIPEDQLGFGLDLSARVKTPTASREKSLGTGKVDVTVGAELSKSFGIVTPFANVSYRMAGDPDNVDLRNTWNASGGASVMLGKSALIGSYDYRQASSDLARGSHELFGAFSTPVAKRLTFTLYSTAGLSDGAPDYGAGSMMAIRF